MNRINALALLLLLILSCLSSSHRIALGEVNPRPDAVNPKGSDGRRENPEEYPWGWAEPEEVAAFETLWKRVASGKTDAERWKLLTEKLYPSMPPGMSAAARDATASSTVSMKLLWSPAYNERCLEVFPGVFKYVYVTRPDILGLAGLLRSDDRPMYSSLSGGYLGQRNARRTLWLLTGAIFETPDDVFVWLNAHREIRCSDKNGKFQ